MEGGLTYRHFRNSATTPSKIYPEHKDSTAKFNEHQPITMVSCQQSQSELLHLNNAERESC